MTDDGASITCVECGKDGPAHDEEAAVGAVVVGAVDSGWIERDRDVWACPDCSDVQVPTSD